MNFKTEEEAKKFISNLIVLDSTGSQGVTYTDREFKKVYKIFHSFLDGDYLKDPDYLSKEALLQFKDIKTKTFIFPKDVIMLYGIVIGYIMPYVPAINLYKLGPYHINLDWLIKVVRDALLDIELISAHKIATYDVMYNIMLGSRLFVIDTQDYAKSPEMDEETLLRKNMIPLNLEVMYFLVDGIFETVIKNNKRLMDMLNSSGQNLNVIDFIIEFRCFIEDLLHKKISTIYEAAALMNQNITNNRYLRLLY